MTPLLLAVTIILQGQDITHCMRVATGLQRLEAAEPMAPKEVSIMWTEPGLRKLLPEIIHAHESGITALEVARGCGVELLED